MKGQRAPAQEEVTASRLAAVFLPSLLHEVSGSNGCQRQTFHMAKSRHMSERGELPPSLFESERKKGNSVWQGARHGTCCCTRHTCNEILSQIMVHASIQVHREVHTEEYQEGLMAGSAAASVLLSDIQCTPACLSFSSNPLRICPLLQAPALRPRLRTMFAIDSMKAHAMRRSARYAARPPAANEAV